MNKFVLLAAAFFIAGCASTTRTSGNKIDRAMVSELKPGATTRQMVIQWFGQPSEVKAADNEERLSYAHKVKRVPQYFGVIENELLGKEDTTTLEVVIKDGVVSSYSYRKTEE